MERNVSRNAQCNYLREILNWVDVLVDGPFIEAEKDISLGFRGSRNQRILRRENGQWKAV